MNSTQLVVAKLARDLMQSVSVHLDDNKDSGRYGGLPLPILKGSEELSESFDRERANYFHTILVTVDFSGM